MMSDQDTALRELVKKMHRHSIACSRSAATAHHAFIVQGFADELSAILAAPSRPGEMDWQSVVVTAYEAAKENWCAQCFCHTSATNQLRQDAHEGAREGFAAIAKILAPLALPVLNAEYHEAQREAARHAPPRPGAATADGPLPNAPDDCDPRTVLRYVRMCASSWEGAARLLGNVRACDIVRACDAYLGAATADAGERQWALDNIYTMAIREERYGGERAKAWAHVRRLCERFNCAVRVIRPAATAEQSICMMCDGCGWCEGSPAFTCPRCKGTGGAR
jgi:hypothetical protein